MKYSKRSRPTLIRLLVLAGIAGTLGWELFMRLLALGGVVIDLSVGPVGFDLEVISLFIMVNPGTFLGAGAGLFLFRRL